MRSVKIEFAPFPERFRGIIRGYATVITEREKYLIVVDSTRAPIVQRRTIGHELAHVFRGHFDTKLSIEFVEKDASRHAWEYYRLYRDGLLDGVTA